MDIRFNAYGNYSVSGKIGVRGDKKAGPSNGSKLVSGGVESKADSISISSDAVSYGEISRLGGAIRSELEAASSSDRIASIKEAIRNGSYSVSSEDVAGAILERFV